MSIDRFLEENHLTLLREFTVLWRGWDCDYKWYLTQNSSGAKILVVSDHCLLRIGSSEELEERIEYYKQITKESEEVLKELESK
jgi:hypothetical protein